jgi:hypothetical protein
VHEVYSRTKRLHYDRTCGGPYVDDFDELRILNTAYIGFAPFISLALLKADIFTAKLASSKTFEGQRPPRMMSAVCIAVIPLAMPTAIASNWTDSGHCALPYSRRLTKVRSHTPSDNYTRALHLEDATHTKMILIARR